MENETTFAAADKGDDVCVFVITYQDVHDKPEESHLAHVKTCVLIYPGNLVLKYTH